MSEPIAWLVETYPAGKFDQFLRDGETAQRFTESASYRVTPLVAAPPEDGRPTYAQLVEALGRCAAQLHADGQAWSVEEFERNAHRSFAVARDARALLSRIPSEEP